MICEFYKSVNDTCGYCLGTREQDTCYCLGDEVYCDFYYDKRQKHEQNPTALDFLRAKKAMCDVEAGYTGCGNCPIAQALKEEDNDIAVCPEYIELFPEKAIQMIMNWKNTHKPPITWNKWLHNLYNYYNGFSTTRSFLNWLNTPIPEETKTLYNIPDE